MPRRYAFIYFMKETPNKIREVLPYHVDYWKDGELEGCIGGPFADRTGGLILFDASCPLEAAAVVGQDPFVVHGLIEERWIKEWMTEV